MQKGAFMLEVNGNDIKLTRGDTAYLTIPITDTISGNDYEMGEDDVLYFSVKKNINSQEYLFQKEIAGGNTFKILPEDTKRLRFGIYIYDVQLNASNGDIFTIIEPSNFEVKTEVTD